MTTIAAQISATGIIAPDYSDVLQQLKIMYWSIYGSDAILDPDSQDGQFLAAVSQAIFDCNQNVISVYNSFSPSTAQGVQLSRLVKLNGLRRNTPTNSQVVVTITGVVGSQITNGVVGDNVNLGTQWNLPTLVIIPTSGTVDVTATASSPGTISAGIGTLTQILTPTLGWQTVTNAAPASLGQAIETDAQLRIRQSKSVALPAMTILEGVYAAVGSVPGVSRLAMYVNDEDVTVNAIPPHSMSVVVSGGDAGAIAAAIALKKAPGTRTNGTTITVITDRNGVPNTIRFYPLVTVPLKVQINVHPLTGYVSTTGDALKQAVADFINSFTIGETSYLARLYSPANLTGAALGATFVVTAITQAKIINALAAADIVIAFNEGAIIDPAQITLVLV